MELTIVILAVVLIYLSVSKKRLKKDLNHQKALVYILRDRLGDNQDNSQLFTIDELTEISKWSDNKIQKKILYQIRNKKGRLPDFEYEIEPPRDIFISGSCKGVTCHVNGCNNDATNKLGEEIQSDDPYPYRHNLTAYVCKQHFKMIVG